MNCTPPFVLIDDAGTSGGAMLFNDALEVLTCATPEDVPSILARIEEALSEGYHVAGYMAYELGYALEPKLAPLMPPDRNGPLIWMGVFSTPDTVGDDLFAGWAMEDCAVTDLNARLSRADYIAQVERIRDHIRAGDVYQINHTFQQDFDFSGSPLALYARLRRRQRARYGALVATGEEHILSLSPELFVEVGANIARTRPMKGTAPRAANPTKDQDLRTWLSRDEKSRAENLMIVDLLRNDLGRVALVGSVNVTDLFSVETYPTLHQMTSGIEAKLRPAVRFADVMRALFPCGSVTGAPKVKAMEIIRTLEAGPRGVYTGAVGYAAPQNGMRFNVAIRTVTLTGGQGRLGIGSGIVHDSEPAAEWDECHLKARFLSRTPEPFDLLETLLWEPDTGYFLLERHLARLTASAAYFGYPCDTDAVRRALDDAADGKTQPQKVRLLMNEDGHARTKAFDFAKPGSDAVLRFAISSNRMDPDNPFLYHKTTNRAFYDDERVRLQDLTGCGEVVFLNTRGELTEGSITNIFVEKNGELLTPPISCGLLDGTLRRDLIASGRAFEAVLTLDDLEGADAVWLGNSVRGLCRAKTIEL